MLITIQIQIQRLIRRINLERPSLNKETVVFDCRMRIRLRLPRRQLWRFYSTKTKTKIMVHYSTTLRRGSSGG